MELSNKEYVLLLGGSIDQLFIIKTAQSMGLGTVVVDANKNAPGLELADYSQPIDFSEISHVVSYVRLLVKKGINLQGVAMMGSDVPHIQHAIAKSLGWVGPKEETAKLTTHKFLMKKCLENNNIPIPNYTLVENEQDIIDAWSAWNCKSVVIKPTDRSGSRGVSIITRLEQIENSFISAKSNSLNNEILLEEYIEGPQISTETIIWKGKAMTPGFADRIYEGMETFWPQIMENGGLVPTTHNESTVSAVNDLVEKSAKALGIHSGVAKGDVVLSADKGPMLIEMAARLSGGDFSESLVPYSTGVNYIEAVLNIALDREPEWRSLEAKTNNTVANRYFFIPEGILNDVIGLDKITTMTEIKKLKIFYSVGQRVPKIENHGQRAGVFIVCAKTKVEVDKIIDIVYESISFVIDGKKYQGTPT